MLLATHTHLSIIVSITAQSSEDYEAVFRTVNFALCQTYSCEIITITVDPVVENRESFNVTLRRT